MIDATTCNDDDFSSACIDSEWSTSSNYRSIGVERFEEACKMSNEFHIKNENLFVQEHGNCSMHQNDEGSDFLKCLDDFL